MAVKNLKNYQPQLGSTEKGVVDSWIQVKVSWIDDMYVALNSLNWGGFTMIQVIFSMIDT